MRPSGRWTRRLLRLLGRRLPRVDGLLRVEGIGSEVIIRRDRWGIPTIVARSDADAWFGLGFCHAQDRGFQLELILRASRGTLAELVGRPGLAIDRLARRVGFERAARRQLEAVAADVRARLDAYVAGINAGLAQCATPHELVLLRASATPWRVTDVLAFGAVQAMILSGNWDAELARLHVLLEDGPQALALVDPVYPAWHPVAEEIGASYGASAAALAAGRVATDAELLGDMEAFGKLAAAVGGGGASNAWAIAPERTASGTPLLANDPHLGPSVPAPWYLAHLRAPGWELGGASFVGSPAFPIGYNGHAAWGITAGCSDSADLFVEEIGSDGRSVRRGDTLVACEVAREEITVRGGATVVEEVLVTPHGPIVSPVLEGVPLALALRAVWLQPLPVRGLLDVARARSFAEFEQAFAEWPGPGLNVVYADRDGTIGYRLVGQLPVRRRGNGTIPLSARDGAAGWEEGLVPWAAMPRVERPANGYVASANDAPRRDDGAGAGPFLGVDWIDGYRAARLHEVLAARQDWDVAGCVALQRDVASLAWRDLRDHLLALTVPADANAARRGLGLLRAWDGEVAAGSAAASVFELTMADLAVRLARETAPGSWRAAVGGGFGDSVPRTIVTARLGSHVVRRVLDGGVDAHVVASLAAAVEWLVARHGDDQARWAWGAVRPLTLRHALGSRPPFDGVFNLGPIAVGGDSGTPAQAGVHPLDPTGNPLALGNVRAVIDLATPAQSRFALAGGQSGNPFSRHYADQLDLWTRGDGVAIPWSDAEVAAATVATLRLTPGAPH